jgi:hypothetical protein
MLAALPDWNNARFSALMHSTAWTTASEQIAGLTQ